MRECGTREEDNEIEMAKKMLKDQEEQEKEQEAIENANDNSGDSADSKFEHSMDDEDEEQDENDDNNGLDKKDNNKNPDDEGFDKNDYSSENNKSNPESNTQGTQEPSTNQSEPTFQQRPNTGPSAGADAGAGTATGTEAGVAGAEVGGAAGGAAGGTAAAGGAAAGGAAGGTAGGVAAGGAAAGGAAVGGAAIAVPLLIVLVIILIIIILIGVAGFFTTMPQFLWNKLKKLALGIWDGVQGYVIGMDESLVNKDDVIGVAQYLYDMGYDLVGMGFAESVEIYGQKDKNGNIIPVTGDHVKNEIKKVDAPFLRAYLVAENRTYLINNFTYNLKDFVNSFFDGSFFGEGFDSWGTGLIDLDSNLLKDIRMPITALRVGEFNLGELLEGVKVERETNTLRIRRWNLELDFWNTHRDYTYFSLAGWAGRYGKPFELMVTVHLATMAPDLAKEIALNKDLDAKVHVKMRKTDFNGKVYVDGQSIEELEEAGTYDEETIKKLKELEKKYASEIKTAIPYISSVTNHWFRNVYFEGTSSTGANSSVKVGVDEDEDGIEDYNEPSGVKTQKTRSLTADDNVYTFGEETEEEITYQGEPIEGVTGTITFRGTMANGMTQTKDAVRGVTNPITKKLFTDKYYIYDGTISTAKKISEARKKHDNSLKQPVRFTKDALSAFAMLEASETLDAQFIYRDLKELVIELGYFEREDFDVIEKQILEWPIPDYIPGEWPDRKIEKQVLEYGTLIACDETVAASLGISLADLRKMTGADEQKETSEENEPTDILKNCLFIGDSYIEGLKANGGIQDADFYGKSGAGPQYWLNNISSLPESASKICVYLGVNRPDEHETMKNLIDALSQKYKNAHIYVIEVMHLGRNYNNVDTINKKIDTFNAQVREKCKIVENASFIDASEGLISGGYLANTDSSGIHMQSGDYSKWAKNIALQIKDTRRISNNDTDERFVVDILEAAKSILSEMKEKKFSYGTPSTIPPQNEEKVISSAGFVSWALYKAGYTDQPEKGLTLGNDGDFIQYCESKNWRKIEKAEDVQAGDIVFTGKLDDEGKKASGVYICAGDGKKYECSNGSHINADQPLSGNIGSNFAFAFRVTGGEAINAGFEEDLDVIAMGNGKVIELLDEGNNLFSLGGLSQQIYGENKVAEAEEVEGRQQTDEGLKIKLTDNALRGYTLIVYGFDVSGVSVGQEVKAGDVIGKTVNSDICVILLDRDRSIIENVEEYMKVPRKEKSSKYMGSALNIQNIEGMNPELAALIEEIAGPYEAEYPGIVNILKAISMNESGGGTNPAAGDDPMQAAESMGQAAGSQVGGFRRSVEAAVAAITNAWDKAKANGIDDLRVVIQSYNYGSGFVDYVVKNSSNKKYSKKLAQEASEYYAAKQGWSSYGDPNYVDPKIYRYLPDLQE